MLKLTEIVIRFCQVFIVWFWVDYTLGQIKTFRILKMELSLNMIKYEGLFTSYLTIVMHSNA